MVLKIILVNIIESKLALFSFSTVEFVNVRRKIMKYIVISLICGFIGLYIGQFTNDEFIMELFMNFGLLIPSVYMISKIHEKNNSV
jgi:uncharacterized membrane protein YfcA